MRCATLVAVVAGCLTVAAVRAEETGGRPMRVVDLLMLGEGTVAGMVTRVGGRYVSLSDGQQTVDVTSRDFAFEALKEGDRITVTGTVERGTLRPSAILRADGTPLPRRGGR